MKCPKFETNFFLKKKKRPEDYRCGINSRRVTVNWRENPVPPQGPWDLSFGCTTRQKAEI